MLIAIKLVPAQLGYAKFTVSKAVKQYIKTLCGIASYAYSYARQILKTRISGRRAYPRLAR